MAGFGGISGAIAASKNGLDPYESQESRDTLNGAYQRHRERALELGLLTPEAQEELDSLFSETGPRERTERLNYILGRLVLADQNSEAMLQEGVRSETISPEQAQSIREIGNPILRAQAAGGVIQLQYAERQGAELNTRPREDIINSLETSRREGKIDQALFDQLSAVEPDHALDRAAIFIEESETPVPNPPGISR